MVHLLVSTCIPELNFRCPKLTINLSIKLKQNIRLSSYSIKAYFFFWLKDWYLTEGSVFPTKAPTKL